MPMNNTEAVLLAFKHGDRKAFAHLCNEYYDYAFRISFRILTCEEDARDIAQEAFIKTWTSRAHYNLNHKFTTWLYTIVTNLCIDVLRKRKNNCIFNGEDILAEVEAHDSGRRLENEEIASIITHLASELSPKQRIVFVLRDLEGLEMHEIAQITHLSPSRIKSNLWHARQSVKQKLTELYKYHHNT